MSFLRESRFLRTVILWMTLAFLHAANLFVSLQNTLAKTPFWIFVAWDVVHATSWLIILPGIAWVTRRQPFSGGVRGVAFAVLVHFITGCLAVAFHILFSAVVNVWLTFLNPGRETVWQMLEYYFGRRFLYLLVYALIVTSILLVDLSRRLREERLRTEQLRNEANEARLQSLYARLQPHFLFNTLHAISTLVTDDPPRAVEMIAGVGDLLRESLNRADTIEVPLHDEISLLERYLAIEEMRFGDRLSVEFRIDAATRAIPVPSFILQPLVENAIQHGVARSSARGRITVSATLSEDLATLCLAVTNNGLAPTGNGGEAGRREGGVGLSTTRLRLESVYGADHASFFLRHEDGLTSATIRLPARRGPVSAVVGGDASAPLQPTLTPAPS